MKKNLTSILIGLSLLAVPAAFADFVIDGNSSTTGYGYGYGNCATDGNFGFLSPCTGSGYSFGYGYGANGLFYPGSSVYGTTGGSSSNGGYSTGGSYVSNSYVGASVTNNSLGLPQTTGATNTTLTTTTTVKPVIKPTKKTKRGSLPATGSDSTMYVLAAFAIVMAAAFVMVKRNKNA